MEDKYVIHVTKHNTENQLQSSETLLGIFHV